MILTFRATVGGPVSGTVAHSRISVAWFSVSGRPAFPVYPNQALNDRGQIVGWSNVATSEEEGAVHAFLWQGGEMQDLGTLGGLSSQATAINNSGVVAGLSQTSQAGGSHAFLWRKAS